MKNYETVTNQHNNISIIKKILFKKENRQNKRWGADARKYLVQQGEF